jgi:hypothetical protein
MAGEVSFSSFNLYNFQYHGRQVYGRSVSAAAYAKKLQWTQNMVLDVDADVFAFQELWSRECLDEVFAHPLLDGRYQLCYLKHDLDDPWYGIAVALAVRKPWKIKSRSKKLIKKFPFTNITKVDENDGEDDEVDVNIDRFSRTVIRVDLELPDEPRAPDIRLFAVHLKSKVPVQVPRVQKNHRTTIGAAVSTIRRTAEATALRWLLTNEMKRKNRPVVVLGDLNDDPNSNTLSIVTEQPTLDSNARGRDTALYSSLQLQQLKSFRDVYYTHEFRGHKDTLDHVLVSQEFFEYASRAKWKHLKTEIWSDFIEDAWPHTTDHGIIKASFKLK